jgi:hypothetical protein
MWLEYVVMALAMWLASKQLIWSRQAADLVGARVFSKDFCMSFAFFG